MIRLISLILFLVASSAPVQARTITDNEARATVLAFVEALARHDLEMALQVSALPFLVPEHRLLMNEDEFVTYFQEGLAVAAQGAFSVRILAVRDFAGTRALVDDASFVERNQVMQNGGVLVVTEIAVERGVFLVSDRGAKIVVVGVGGCGSGGLC